MLDTLSEGNSCRLDDKDGKEDLAVRGSGNDRWGVRIDATNVIWRVGSRGYSDSAGRGVKHSCRSITDIDIDSSVL